MAGTVTRDDVIGRLTQAGQRFEIVQAEVGGSMMPTYRNAVPSLRDVLVSSSEFSAREFLVYEEVRWTYGEHLALVVDLADALQVRGVAKGDRVAIAMRNFPEWSVAFWAAQALGAVVVPLNALVARRRTCLRDLRFGGAGPDR